MKTLLQIAKTIMGWLLAGLDDLKVDATPGVLKYLELLRRLATKGIGIPLAVAAMAFLGYGITTTFVDILQYWGWTGRFWSWVALLLGKTEGLWSSVIALAGIVSFVYAWLLSVLISPIGVVAHATVPGARSVPTTPVTVSWGTLAGSILTEIRDARVGVTNALHAGVEKYVHQVRFSLTCIGGTYLVAAMFPNLRGVVFQLILGTLFFTAMKGFKNPIATFLRFAFCGAFLWFIAAQTFPALNPFKAAFGNGPEAVTMGNVETTVKSLWDSINTFFLEGWTKPAFWLLLIAVGPVMYVAYRALLAGLAKKVPATQAAEGGDSHATTTTSHSHGGSEHHSSSGGGNGRLGTIVATIVILLGIWFVWSSVVSWDEHRVAGEVRRHTIAVNEAVRRENTVRAAAAVPSTPPRNGGARVASEPKTPDMASPSLIATSRPGIQNAKGYVLALSTHRLSLGVPFPPQGHNYWIEPEEHVSKVDVFINGMKWKDRVPGAQNSVPLGGTFFQYLATDPSVTNIIVWLGKRVTTRR